MLPSPSKDASDMEVCFSGGMAAGMGAGSADMGGGSAGVEDDLSKPSIGSFTKFYIKTDKRRKAHLICPFLESGRPDPTPKHSLITLYILSKEELETLIIYLDEKHEGIPIALFFISNPLKPRQVMGNTIIFNFCKSIWNQLITDIYSISNVFIIYLGEAICFHGVYNCWWPKNEFTKEFDCSFTTFKIDYDFLQPANIYGLIFDYTNNLFPTFAKIQMLCSKDRELIPRDERVKATINAIITNKHFLILINKLLKFFIFLDFLNDWTEYPSSILVHNLSNIDNKK